MMNKKSKRFQRWSGVSSLLLAVVAAVTISWTSFSPTQEGVSGETVIGSDKMPLFKGCDQVSYEEAQVCSQKKLMEYMVKAINYPQSAKQKNIQGKVMVSFTVKENGDIKDVKVLRGVHPDLDKEAQRVIQMMPDWTPGEKDGKKVAVSLVQPVSFQLKD